MDRDIQKGQWIRKENWTPFKGIKGQGLPKIGGEYWGKPVMKIERLKFRDKTIYINGRGFRDTNIIVIPEDEAKDIIEKWNNCILSETIFPFEISSCVREDTGEDKAQFKTESSAREVAFQKRMKNPGIVFEFYLCNHCKSYHVGKSKEINDRLTQDQIKKKIEEVDRKMEIKKTEWESIIKKRQEEGYVYDTLNSFSEFLEFIGVELRHSAILDRQFRMSQNYTLSPIPDYGNLMSIEDFVICCESGGFVDYDGYGYYVEEKGMTSILIKPSDIEYGAIRQEFKKIIWFNR